MKTFRRVDIPILQRKVLTWFREHQRRLPWRDTYDPYRVWISEIMLQQTQMKTVLPYFGRWMAALPTIRSVARADRQTLLKLWEGLGYYSRARHIQKAARIIMERFGGRFPERYEAILGLPGIGRYTAGAIASIAFNQNCPVVDGNIVRVIARLLNYSKNTRTPQNHRRFWHWAETLLPEGQSRDFNQGMMELGALICTPKKPACGKCPLRSKCQAYQANTMESLPNRGPVTQKIPLKVAIAVIQKNGKVFIQRRPGKGLMGGLYEFPGGKVESDETPGGALRRELREELGITVKKVKPIMNIKHAYTRFKVDLFCFKGEYDQGTVQLKAAMEGKWVRPEELRNYPFPSANGRLIDKLLENN